MNLSNSSRDSNNISEVSKNYQSHLGRKKLEINRRIALLQHKRISLERELRAINTALTSLSKHKVQ